MENNDNEYHIIHENDGICYPGTKYLITDTVILDLRGGLGGGRE